MLPQSYLRVCHQAAACNSSDSRDCSAWCFRCIAQTCGFKSMYFLFWTSPITFSYHYIANGFLNLQMFVFGTMALEQFVERLIEWPQYCNHILQISHLRNTHSELVVFIEQALARISSGNSDPEGSNHASAVHHHGPSQVTSGNVEVSVVGFVTCVKFMFVTN